MAELPNLVDITDGDPDWTWDVCIFCGSPEVTHRALCVGTDLLGIWGARRIGWCAAEVCQADRKVTAALGQVVAVNADGVTKNAWATS